MENIKIICVEDVVMLEGYVAFTKGKIYEAKKIVFGYESINNNNIAHTLGFDFFNKHFLVVNENTKPKKQTYAEKLLKDEKVFLEERIANLEQAVDRQKKLLKEGQEKLESAKKDLSEILEALAE